MRAQHAVHVLLLLWVVIWSCHARGMNTIVEKERPVIDIGLLKKDLKTQLVLTFLYLTTTYIDEEDYFYAVENRNIHPIDLLLTLLEHIEENKIDSLSSKDIRIFSLAFFEIYLSTSIFTAQSPEETLFMSTFWESYSKDRFMLDLDITEEHLLKLQAFSKKKVLTLLNTFKELIFLQKAPKINKVILQDDQEMYHDFIQCFRTACFTQVAQPIAKMINTFSHDDLKEKLQQQLKIDYSQANDLATHIKKLTVERIAGVIEREYSERSSANKLTFSAIFLPNELISMPNNDLKKFTLEEKKFLYENYKHMPKKIKAALDVAAEFGFRNYFKLDPMVEALQAEFTEDTIENLYQAMGTALYK